MPNEAADVITIAPRSGTAFLLLQGQCLKVIDPKGQQVADLVAFNANARDEHISSGRTLDYAERLVLTSRDCLYSNRSQPMMKITEDTVGRHDFTLEPCCADTFRIIYNDQNPHCVCFGNLHRALEPFGITKDMIPVAFNVFMNVDYGYSDNGFKLTVHPPRSRPGDFVVLEAQIDLIIGLTACAADQSNNYRFKEIQYQVL